MCFVAYAAVGKCIFDKKNMKKFKKKRFLKETNERNISTLLAGYCDKKYCEVSNILNEFNIIKRVV